MAPRGGLERHLNPRNIINNTLQQVARCLVITEVLNIYDLKLMGHQLKDSHFRIQISTVPSVFQGGGDVPSVFQGGYPPIPPHKHPLGGI